MESSRSAVQTGTVNVNPIEINFKNQVREIQAGDLSKEDKETQIKLLTHTTALSIFQRNKRLKEDLLSAPNFVGKIAEYADLSLNSINQMRAQVRCKGLALADPIALTRFFYNIKRMLTPEENCKICGYIESMINNEGNEGQREADHATNEEIEQCFSQIGVNVREANLSSIRKAIQGTFPSKQDVECTARAIEKELKRHLIDYAFPEFSDKKFEKELRDIINSESFPSDAITRLSFSQFQQPLFRPTIKVVPNVLGAFKKLEILDLRPITSLTTPPNLSGNPALTHLSLWGCKELTTPPDLRSNPALTSLNLSYCTSLTTPPDVRSNPALEILDLLCCTGLVTPPDVSSNIELINLHLSGCTGLTTPPDLRGNPALELLDLEGGEGLTTPPDLSRNPELRDLDLNGCTGLTTLPDLSMLTQLKYLDVRGVFPLHSGLNRAVSCPDAIDRDCHNKTQALIRDIEAYRLSLHTETTEGPGEVPVINPPLITTRITEDSGEIPVINPPLITTRITEGPGEIPVSNYRKTVFDHFAIFFTMTIPNFFRAIADFFRNCFKS